MDFKPCNSSTILQFHGPYRRQSFSLSDSIIYYITKNPTTPKVYQKLVKSCKYFFTKNPIIIFDSLSQFIYLGGGGVLYGKNLSKRIKFDINKISIKIWINTIFQISSENPKFFSSLIPKIYRCDANHIYLNKQDILLDDFIFFTKSVKYFSARDSKILKSNGTEAFMEEILQVLPNLKEFQFFLKNNCSSYSVKNVLKLSNFSNICVFKLCGLTDNFDVQTIFEYAKKNKSTKFTLNFNVLLSDEFKNQLEQIIDEIIESANVNYIPIFISYPGMNEEKETLLFSLVLKHV